MEDTEIMDTHCSMVPPSTVSTNRNISTEEVLRQITHSGFLTSEELGRLLLVSCKTFIHNVGEEDVWQAICKSRWRHTSQLPRSFLSRGGFKSYFQQMSSERPLTHYYSDEKIWHDDSAPSTLKIENFLIAVSIRNKRGEIYSKVLKGDDLTEFLFRKNGCQSLGFEHPIELGRLRADGCHSTFKYTSIVDAADLLQHWSATVHLIRFDTNMCCCIYKSTKDYEYDQILHFMSMGLKLAESSPISQGRIVLRTDTEYTEFPGGETALTRRLDPRGAAEKNTRYFNMGMQITMPCTASLVVTPDNKKEARFIVNGIHLRILSSVYVSGGDYGYGVPFLHVLDTFSSSCWLI
jgi:hypothetical protein